MRQSQISLSTRTIRQIMLLVAMMETASISQISLLVRANSLFWITGNLSL
jgi:hypothetical protein